MASTKYQGGKFKGGTAAKAEFRHNDITPESRKRAKKKNKHIDVTKSHLNQTILGLTYAECCKKYDERIGYIDRNGNRNIRKDRVTLQAIEIPVPEGLPRDKYMPWFREVAHILVKKYGYENFIDGQIHFDEEHEYIDAETKELRMSRVHGHFEFVPVVNGQLNAKKFAARSNMIRLNNAIEKMTKKQFGCSFMTGEKKKSKDTVEELKAKSEALKAEREVSGIEAENERLKAENERLDIGIKRKTEKYDRLSEANESLDRMIGQKQNYLSNLDNTVADVQNRLKLLSEEEEKVKHSITYQKAQFGAKMNAERKRLEEEKQQWREERERDKAKCKNVLNAALAIHQRLLNTEEAYLSVAMQNGEEIGKVKKQAEAVFDF